MTIRISSVHAKQIARKQRRLFSAHSASDLNDHISIIVGVFRQKQDRKFLLEFVSFASKCRQFRADHRMQIVIVRLLEQQLILFDIADDFFVLSKLRNDLLERRMLAIDFGEAFDVGDDRRIAQH